VSANIIFKQGRRQGVSGVKKLEELAKIHNEW
jgi:hypothetical protein